MHPLPISPPHAALISPPLPTSQCRSVRLEISLPPPPSPQSAHLHSQGRNSICWISTFDSSPEVGFLRSSGAPENIDRKPSRCYCNLKRPAKSMEDSPAQFSTMMDSNSPQFSLMMENLNKLEDIFAGADLVGLEGDILLHMGRLGALKLFHACLSRTSMESASNKQNFILPNYFGDFPEDSLVGEKKDKIIVRTEKNEKRKARRNRASYKVVILSKLSVSSKKIHKVESSSIALRTGSSSLMVSSKFRRVIIARSESEMSRGVKEVAELERTQSRLKLQLGRTASYAPWAEAAGIDQETLQQRLQFGWHCREKLLRSTQSLVV